MAKTDYIFSREDKVQTFYFRVPLAKWVMEIQMYVMFDYIVQCVIFLFLPKKQVCVSCSCSPFRFPKFTPHHKKRPKLKIFFRNIFNSIGLRIKYLPYVSPQNHEKKE